MAEENFWTLWCKGRLTEADTLTIRLGASPSGLTSAYLHHSPSPSTLITWISNYHLYTWLRTNSIGNNLYDNHTRQKHDFHSYTVNSKVRQNRSNTRVVNYGMRYLLIWKMFIQRYYSWKKNLRKVCCSRFSTEFILEMYIIAQTYLRFCKNKPKPYIGILLPVSSFFCESDHWRCSYDVKIFKMAAVDVANQLPVPVW